MRRARHKNQKKNIKQKKVSELKMSSSPLFSEKQMAILRAWEKRYEQKICQKFNR